jgi:hypothetical protein
MSFLANFKSPTACIHNIEMDETLKPPNMMMRLFNYALEVKRLIPPFVLTASWAQKAYLPNWVQKFDEIVLKRPA